MKLRVYSSDETLIDEMDLEDMDVHQPGSRARIMGFIRECQLKAEDE